MELHIYSFVDWKYAHSIKCKNENQIEQVYWFFVAGNFGNIHFLPCHLADNLWIAFFLIEFNAFEIDNALCNIQSRLMIPENFNWVFRINQIEIEPLAWNKTTQRRGSQFQFISNSVCFQCNMEPHTAKCSCTTATKLVQLMRGVYPLSLLLSDHFQLLWNSWK